MLASDNAHERDTRVRLEPTRHRYYVDGEPGYLSVTSWNKQHFAPFDSDAVIARMRAGRNWSESEYHNLSDGTIKKLWSERGRVASSAGTQLHDQIENYFNGMETSPAPSSQEYGYFKDFWMQWMGTLIPYRTEWLVFDESIRVAGAVDMVFKDPGGNFHIYDWKRTKPISRTTSYGCFSTTACLAHLPDTNFWHYALQLNVYKAILEKNYDINISSMHLVRLHPDAPGYEDIEVPELTTEVATLWADRKLSIRPKRKRETPCRVNPSPSE